MTTETLDAALAVSASDFMAALLEGAQRGEIAWIADFPGDPGGPAAAWGGRAYSAAIDPPAVNATAGNWYVCPAALARGEDGKVARRKANFNRLMALVADDCDVNALLAEPSAIVQTSPGSSQVYMMLHADDRDARDVELVTRLLGRMSEAGLVQVDRSGNSATRYSRGPGGFNHKPRTSGPYRVHLTHWAPHRRMSLAEAAAAFGIDLEEVRQARIDRQPGGMLVSGEQDERMRVLTRNILGGTALHESINVLAASLVASGTQGGAAVNLLRALMDSSIAPRDDRWQQRYNDIPRSVATAQDKFRAAAPPAVAEAASAEMPPLFVPVHLLLSEIRSIQWLVKGYLETDALSMAFGAPAGGKSFVLVDLACCIATGTPWHGMEVRQGPVFYVAGEGHAGLARRFAAWTKASGVPITEKTPLYKSTRAVMMLDETAAAGLQAEVDRMVAETGQIPVLVVIDTLARNFGDGDENKQADAGKYIEHLDRYIRRKYGCNVMTAHHSGHEMERARGSSSLKAAMDQEIWIKNTAGRIELKMTKMKDAEMPQDIQFRITQIGLGVEDENGQEVLGAYLKRDGNPLDVQVGKRGDGKPITAKEIVVAMRPKWEGSNVMQSIFELSERTLTRVMTTMRESGWVSGGQGRGGYKLTDLAINHLSLAGGLVSGVHNADDEGA